MPSISLMGLPLLQCVQTASKTFKLAGSFPLQKANQHADGRYVWWLQIVYHKYALEDCCRCSQMSEGSPCLESTRIADGHNSHSKLRE